MKTKPKLFFIMTSKADFFCKELKKSLENVFEVCARAICHCPFTAENDLINFKPAVVVVKLSDNNFLSPKQIDTVVNCLEKISFAPIFLVHLERDALLVREALKKIGFSKEAIEKSIIMLPEKIEINDVAQLICNMS